MTHRDLIQSARFLLHDTDRASDTSARFYADDEIARQLTASLADLMLDLIVPPPDPKTGRRPPRPAPLAISSLIAQQVFVAWQDIAGGGRRAPLQEDFFLLECGLKANDAGARFLPADTVPKADTVAGLATSGVPRLYARAGWLYCASDPTGNHRFEADLVYYWRRPPTIAADSDDTLPLFNDGLYNCVKYLACRDLIIKHSKGAPHRWVFFNNEYLSKKGSLQ